MSSDDLGSVVVCGRPEPLFRRDRDLEFDALAYLLGRPSGPLLDIGYGAGHLLDRAAHWSIPRSQQFGVEDPVELRALAAKKGFTLLDENFGGSGHSFGLITAVDVLEHLTQEQCRQLLSNVARSLKPDGMFVARFPNGGSPFGRYWQHGDPTHVRALTGTALATEAAEFGLSLAYAGNLRPMPIGMLARIKRGAAYMIRDLVEIAIGFAYFGKRMPMDGNVVVALKLREPR